MSNTRIGIGLDNASDGVKIGRNIAQQAKEALRGLPPSLALLFVSYRAPKQVLKGVLQILDDVLLIGSTSAGEYSSTGYVENGAGLMLIHSEQSLFYPIGYQSGWWRRSQPLLGQLIGTSDDGFGSRFNHRSLMLFPDDRSMNLDDVITQAIHETGMLYNILGGPSPTVEMPPPRSPTLFFNSKLFHNGMVGAEVLSQNAFGLSIANGWKPVSGPYRITDSEKNLISKIDGRPAREIYEDFLLAHKLPLDYLDSPELIKYPIGICAEGDCRVSLAMGFNHEGGLKVTSAPPSNTIIHILATEQSAMTAAARRSIERALQNTTTPPAGILFIDCMSTAMVLGESYSQQQQIVGATIGDVPFLGFRSHGVLARLSGQTNGHYECSVGTWVIPE